MSKIEVASEGRWRKQLEQDVMKAKEQSEKDTYGLDSNETAPDSFSNVQKRRQLL